jgi:glycosyltransferase involved in cell wall biosynthesis
MSKCTTDEMQPLAPSLTCVIAAYKQSPFLEACVRSLLAQSAPCNVIITSSTPTAALQKLAAQFQVPLRLNKIQAGIASDWNFALDQGANGLVVVCHQDDVYEPDFARHMLALWGTVPGLLMAISDHVELLPDGIRDHGLNLWVKRKLLMRAFRRSNVVSSGFARRRMLSFGNPVCCPGVVLNLDALAGFRFDATWQINLDWDAWERILRKPGQIGFINKRLVAHRIHSASETSAGIGDRRRDAEDLKMFQRFWPGWVAHLLMLFYRKSYHSNQVRA